MNNQKNIASAKKYALEVKGYTKQFKKFVAVQNVSFNVSPGKIHGFIGPNGSGKTTTIKAIIGAYHQKKGNIFIEGFKAGTAKAKKRIGYIPERASFPANLNCLEYLVTMSEMSGFSHKEATKKALGILKELDLLKHRYRKPILFSSGMKKKILVAQALILNPTVLVLDEPAANLDPTARKEMFEMFRTVQKQGTSIFLSSHILSELQGIIDEVTFISQGEIKYTGEISKLLVEEGCLVTFLYSNSTKAQTFIKKHKLVNTTAGWKKLTKNKQDTDKFVQALLNSHITVMNIAFLRGNLNSAYDKLVLSHGSASGVETKPLNFFQKLFGHSNKKIITKAKQEKLKGFHKEISKKSSTVKPKMKTSPAKKTKGGK